MKTTIESILDMQIIAVVGMSPNPARPSHGVAMYLKSQGYTIIPVNPGRSEIEGLPCYHDLESIPGAVDVVDVFRAPEACAPIAQSAVDIGAKALWLQEGVVNVKAVRIAEDAGLLTVQDKCLLKEHRRIKG